MAGPVRRSPRTLGLADQALDLLLHRVGQLEAVPAEDLDAVVVVGVVAGADDDAGVGAHADREVRHRRGRHRPAQEHAAPHRGHPGRDRGLEHVAGEAGVLADEHARRVALPAARDEGHGAAQGQRQLGGHGVDVRHPADAVGAEERPGGGRDVVMAALLSRCTRTDTSAGRVSSTLMPAWPGAISTPTGRRGRTAPCAGQRDVGLQVAGRERADERGRPRHRHRHPGRLQARGAAAGDDAEPLEARGSRGPRAPPR